MGGSRCPAESRLDCPWLANIDAEIGFAKDDLEHRRFFGKQGAQQKVDTLIEQRQNAQQIIESSDCPSPEIRSSAWGQTMLCGVLVVNSALQKFDEELTQQIRTEEA